LANWSGNHVIKTARLFKPKSAGELEALVTKAHVEGSQLRPVGKFLSPNGVAAAEHGMVSLEELDKVLHMDLDRLEITVEAGVLVETVLSTLAEHELTLLNFSSITDQQMGGWTQVSAHGTGATLPTVDEMITRLKIVTPAKGTLELSETQNPDLFKLARAGVGALGVVSELTLKCAPKHRLHERTFATTMSELRSPGPRNHASLLQRFRHTRFMWLPSTETCVVVVSNPEGSGEGGDEVLSGTTAVEPDIAIESLRRMARETPGVAKPDEDLTTLSFAGLRDRLLDVAPLDAAHVKRVNQAEAVFWHNSEGSRVDESQKVLGFDCGGQQQVLEVCFPVGTLEKPDGKDLDFIAELRQAITDRGLPAPAPIEQRWTSRSSSPMSPAFAPTGQEDRIFSWVGIIMYLPPGQDELGREAIAKRFKEYSDVVFHVGKKYGAVPHWAKIELPPTHWSTERQATRVKEMRQILRERFDVKAFNKARSDLDPKHILSNKLISTLFDR